MSHEVRRITQQRLEKVISLVKKNGGATLSWLGKPVTFEEGYQVSLIHEANTVMDISNGIDKEELASILETISDQVVYLFDTYIGLWIDNNKLYCEVSLYVTGTMKAVTLAELFEQRYIYDWELKTSLRIQ